MSTTATTTCPNCQRLEAEVASLRAELLALRHQLGQLQEQLAAALKDSSTSSKPPSSDIVKPPRPAPPDGAKRRQGGQPGHDKHSRALVPPELLTAPPHEHRLYVCPDCGGNLLHAAEAPFRLIQQVELPDVPIAIEEHRCFASRCPRCQTSHYAPFPLEVQHGGLVGPRLTTLIAFLKGFCHATFSTIRKFLRDVAQVTISRSQLANVINKVSAALEGPYQQLLDDLRKQDMLNVDETGHKDNGQRMWTWCFRASLYTLFKIDPSRSADVLIEVLGREFKGVLGCDYFSAYRRYMRECNVRLQFCLAHLIRDLKYLLTLPDLRDQSYGHNLLQAVRELFCVIHRRANLSEQQFQTQMEEARQKVLRYAKEAPATAASEAIATRFAKHGDSYLRFITTPGVEPTNNLAEQAIRFVVIDRKVTQGTRGQKGQRWCERIWTVIATCAQQGKSVFDYLYRAVKAAFNDQEVPSLLPAKV